MRKAWETLKSLYLLKKTLLPSERRFPKFFVEILLIVGTMFLLQSVIQQIPAAPSFLSTLPKEQFRMLSVYFGAIFLFGAVPFAYLAVLLSRLIRQIKNGIEAYKTAKEMQEWMQSLATSSASDQD